MRVCRSTLAGFALAALARCTAGLGARIFPTLRNLQLAADLGLDPTMALLHRKEFRTAVANCAAADVPTEYAEIPIDHDDLSVGTYKNRYWVSEEHYLPGGPVFVYDVGEMDAEQPAKTYLTNSTSFFKKMLKEFHGIGIAWEHRYYGASLPFPVNLDTPPEHFKYLNNKQALADLPYFARNFSRDAFPKEDLTPRSTPWIMVGGSYSGMRAAFSRDKYPDTFFAAFASSAPVEARIDMSAYFDQVYRGMVAYGYGNCTKDIQAVNSYIDSQLSNNQTAAAVKQLFLGKGAEQNSNGDFTLVLTSIYDIFQGYGMGGGESGLGAFCDYLETDPDTNRVAGPDGLAPLKGNKMMAERAASWPWLVSLVNSYADTNCKGVDKDRPLSCELGNRASDVATISWTWQYCTQWGYFQSNNFGPRSLLSKYQTLDYYQSLCYRQFPGGLESGLLPEQPQVEAVNNETGGWTMRPSNVYWSGGQFDPWRALSPLSSEPFAPKDIELVTDPPACGVETSENKLFGYVMEDAEHCFDFDHNFALGEVSRGYFVKALKEWLKCFKKEAGE